MQLTDKEIQDNILKMVEIESFQGKKKQSFCRYYLRGLCIYQAPQCIFSHGVHDLDYIHWEPNELIQQDYLKDTDFCQKRAIKGPKIYKDLYQYQKVKIYTLEQLNDDRKKRQQLRVSFHKKLFKDFIKLLQEKHPDALFTEDFLVRQYTRVGFNKLMTRIKFSHLTTHLCNQDDSQYFLFSSVMPPLVKKEKNFLVKMANVDEIDEFYQLSYRKIIEQHKKQTIDEGTIKKLFFGIVRPSVSIPPLNIYLKIKKISFSVYLRSLLGETIPKVMVKFEADVFTLVESSKKFLIERLSNSFVEWNDVYKFLSKQHQINNGNTINLVKPLLVVEGFRFLFFPMTQFITHPQIQNNIHYKNHQQCPCGFKKIYTNQELSILTESLQNQNLFQLQHKESYDIFDLQTLLKCAPSIYNSKILAVDIQGRLRKNGYIEMIQLNNQNNTFLIDIYRMDLNGDVETFNLTKKLLRNVLENQKILKIFHDCRHDSLALHQFMECCVKNVYDTSAAQTYKGQIQLYQGLNQLASQNILIDQQNNEKKEKLYEKKAKDILAQANNIKTPGLNEVLKIYNAPHGINKNKQLFHSMWGKGQTSLFDQRPLNIEYREYCIKDVLDLPHVYNEMTKQKKKGDFDQELAKWISSQYVKYGYLSTEEGQGK